MSVKKTTRMSKLKRFFGVFLVLIGMLTGLTRLTFANEDVYAVPETVNTAEQTQTEQQQTEQD